MPLIRYVVGDRATAGDSSPCPCGRPLPTVAHIDGRIDDTLVTRDGRRIGRHVSEPFGAASNPLSDEGVAAKFIDLAAPRLSGARAKAVLEQLWAVDRLADVAPLAEALAL
jgi:hypothetical protein